MWDPGSQIILTIRLKHFFFGSPCSDAPLQDGEPRRQPCSYFIRSYTSKGKGPQGINIFCKEMLCFGTVLPCRPMPLPVHFWFTYGFCYHFNNLRFNNSHKTNMFFSAAGSACHLNRVIILLVSSELLKGRLLKWLLTTLWLLSEMSAAAERYIYIYIYIYYVYYTYIYIYTSLYIHLSLSTYIYIYIYISTACAPRTR